MVMTGLMDQMFKILIKTRYFKGHFRPTSVFIRKLHWLQNVKI